MTCIGVSGYFFGYGYAITDTGLYDNPSTLSFLSHLYPRVDT
jgi:hypothetical protein